METEWSETMTRDKISGGRVEKAQSSLSPRSRRNIYLIFPRNSWGCDSKRGSTELSMIVPCPAIGFSGITNLMPPRPQQCRTM